MSSERRDRVSESRHRGLLKWNCAQSATDDDDDDDKDVRRQLNHKWRRKTTLSKYPYMHGSFVARLPYFNGTSSVYVCIRKSTE